MKCSNGDNEIASMDGLRMSMKHKIDEMWYQTTRGDDHWDDMKMKNLIKEWLIWTQYGFSIWLILVSSSAQRNSSIANGEDSYHLSQDILPVVAIVDVVLLWKLLIVDIIFQRGFSGNIVTKIRELLSFCIYAAHLWGCFTLCRNAPSDGVVTTSPLLIICLLSTLLAVFTMLLPM